MGKKKCAFFVHLEWNKITSSSDFFKELLEDAGYEVKAFQRVEWNDKNNRSYLEINRGFFDIAVFWHVLPPASFLRKLKCRVLVWAPMYDGVNGVRLAKAKFLFYKGTNLKVVCFSKKLSDSMKFFFNCRYFQYFPKPLNKVKSYSKKRLFFWERIRKINWDFVKANLFELNELDSIVIKQVNDPFNQMERLAANGKNTRIIRGWLPRADYLKLLSESNIFVAPRHKEGIGHGFLEPLSMGQVVIANNDSTMNEYIENKKTGILFNLRRPEKIDLSEMKSIGRNAREYMEKGYKKWKEKYSQELLNWISR